MKLSVIVPIYNVEKYITRCATSLFAQKYKDFEIIFVDDGSRDQSISILKKIIEDNNILNCKIIHKRNEGLPQARKTGVENAKGEFVSFVDSDDWIEEDYYLNAMKFVEDNFNSADIFNLGYTEDYDDGKMFKKATQKEFRIIDRNEYVQLLHQRILFHTMWSKIIRRKTLEDFFNFPYGNFIFEDYITLIPSLKYVEKIGLIPESGYHYIIRKESMGHGGFNESKRMGFENMDSIYPRVINWYPQCVESINSFFSIEYMAIIISMGKNKSFDNRIVRIIKRFLSSNFRNIIRSSYVDYKFKISIIPIIIFPKLFSLSYDCIFGFREP